MGTRAHHGLLLGAEPTDPLFGDVVLLLDGDWTDLSIENQSPAFTGTAPAASGGNIEVISSSGYAKYTHEFAAASQSFCFEYWVELIAFANASAPIWDRYAVAGLYNGSEVGQVGDGALGNSGGSSSGDLTVFNGIYNTFTPASVAMADNLELHHFAVVRSGSADTHIFVNGYPASSLASAPAIEYIRLGNLNGGNWTSCNFKRVRATKNATRYDISSISPGVQTFVPDASFPST